MWVEFWSLLFIDLRLVSVQKQKCWISVDRLRWQPKAVIRVFTRSGGLFLKSSTRLIAQVDRLYLLLLFPVILSRRRRCVLGESQK